MVGGVAALSDLREDLSGLIHLVAAHLQHLLLEPVGPDDLQEQLDLNQDTYRGSWIHDRLVRMGYRRSYDTVRCLSIQKDQ